MKKNNLTPKKEEYFVHPSSYIDENVSVGRGTKIWHFCHIMKGARLGKNCNLGQNVFIAEGVKIGNNVKIQNNVSVYMGVTVEDDCFLGPSAVFTNILNPRSRYPQKDKFIKTLVKKGTTIGANATIICGITLGKHSFIGAGCVVTKDVPDYGLVIGNPGHLAGWMCACGKKLNKGSSDTICCLGCGRKIKIK